MLQRVRVQFVRQDLVLVRKSVKRRTQFVAADVWSGRLEALALIDGGDQAQVFDHLGVERLQTHDISGAAHVIFDGGQGLTGAQALLLGEPNSLLGGCDLGLSGIVNRALPLQILRPFEFAPYHRRVARRLPSVDRRSARGLLCAR